MVDADQYTHLHVHSDASRIDGLGVVDRLVAGAASKGYPALALTDHGSLANTVTFIAACSKSGIKPIIGLEGYLEVDGKVGHITLLADGNEGLKSLVEINNSGQRGEYTRPAFNVDVLINHCENVLLLTGCPASPLQSMADVDALALGRKLKGAFGSRMFAEAMFVSDQPTWERSAKLAKDLRIPLVTTNDAHFPFQEDAAVHTILTQLKAGFHYESRFLWLATPTEIEKRIVDRGQKEALPIARSGFKNAALIARNIRSVTFSGVPTLPHIPNANQTLLDYVKIGFNAKSRAEKWTPDQVKESKIRALKELDIIQEMDFATYFLILRDMVAFAKSSDIRVGPGRGSGAGSLVLYLLDVTEINPLKYDLSFERFLNPKRKGMPDVDVDFDSEGRHAVIEYAKSRWGAFPVATYSRYSHKMLVHDLAKYFHLPRDLELGAIDEDVDGPNFREMCRQRDMFRPSYDAMMGQIRHMGQHAGGVIITNAAVPLERASNPNRTLVAAWTEGENKELTTAGIVKYDLLALSALSILQRLENQHGRRADDLAVNDPVFQLFRDGDLGGVFQFSGSDGIVEYTKRVGPDRFEDIVAINALYRPGALDAGTAKHYPEWRTHPRSLHPLIDPILTSTYGVIVYQEQVQAIFAALTDGDLGSADEARRAISKTKPGDPKWESQLAELEQRLYDGARAKGLPDELIEVIWTEMKTHTRYSFNKSHSVSYAKIACDMAWWKSHYPIDFYAATLTVDLSEQQRYIFEVVNKGITIVPPHVNVSTSGYVSDGKQIYMPLSVIKYLGAPAVQAIMDARPFSSYEDFMARVPKKLARLKARQGLFEIGAFSGLAGDPRHLQIHDPQKMSRVQRHMTFMGFFIPTKRQLEIVTGLTSFENCTVAGIIREVVEKESTYGKYKVYYMLPKGSVWSREIELQVGQWVKIKYRKNSGKILKAEILT